MALMKTKKRKAMRLADGSRSIGIVSGMSGEGVTTMALALSSYICGVNSMKAAVVRVGSGNEIQDIAQAYYGEYTKEMYGIFGVDYYAPGDTAGLSWIYAKGYDYVIIDFGKEYERYTEELVRCTMKLVMGSVNLWRYEHYVKLCRYLKNVPGSESWLHIVSGDRDDIKSHLKKESLIGMERVMIANPYVIEDEQINFFQKIL